MEEILKDILYELKKINHRLDEESNPIKLKVKLDEDVIAEKVINNINKQSRLNGKTTIVV